ncbi:hypothetical protein A500_09178 [Clostridium sartagoforme AAU1]|jgi:isoleucyl-tRNA synthetase|uniref:DUF3284 domain-containing protein n=1 Tax=Clostridium sartagoforme AAU1 TaxID=1202534 RepID=R9C9M3_9CLOT|nr:DUF3284 domain-containing protein [Clostridium sartagoforme]EOR26027.1 hypothetical protein A500_09178 [Clostridium sartagoforme AAU1]
MSIYKGNIIINYPIEKVFKVFIDLNKQQIPKFNDKNPTEVSYKKVVKTVGKQKIEMVTTITGFEKDNLYEVTNTINKDKYVSRYEFKGIDSSSTEISLSESQEIYAFSSSLTLLFEKITAKKKMKNKLEGIREALELEIKRRYKESNDSIK